MKINRETITLAIAIVGAALGIVNSWWAITSGTINVSVEPYPAFKTEENILMVPRDWREFQDGLSRLNEPSEIVVKIVNTGRAAAWVTRVGFIDEAQKQRFYLLSPDLKEKGQFTLSPNEPRNINTNVTPILRQKLLSGLETAFVDTGEGKLFVGSTDVWKRYLQWLKKSNTDMKLKR